MKVHVKNSQLFFMLTLTKIGAWVALLLAGCIFSAAVFVISYLAHIPHSICMIL